MQSRTHAHMLVIFQLVHNIHIHAVWSELHRTSDVCLKGFCFFHSWFCACHAADFNTFAKYITVRCTSLEEIPYQYNPEKKPDQPTLKCSLIHATSTGRRLLQHIFTFVLQLFTDTKSQLNIIYLWNQNHIVPQSTDTQSLARDIP